MTRQVSTIQLELSFDQLAAALQSLSFEDKLALWRLLDQEVDRATLDQRFARSLAEIRAAYAGINEDEVMEDVLKAQQEVRALRRNA